MEGTTCEVLLAEEWIGNYLDHNPRFILAMDVFERPKPGIHMRKEGEGSKKNVSFQFRDQLTRYS
jgi:hypothetical protein